MENDTAASDPSSSPTRPGGVSDLWRLRPWVRPYWGSMLVMFLAAAAATFAGLAIPLLARSVVDGPIADGQRSALWWIGLLALAFGLLETFLIYLRRYALARSSLGIEADIRRDLYAHLQSLPVAFHDRWQSGQLLSRASTDLSQLRRFIGFGLVFLVVNTVTFFAVAALLLATYWPLGSIVLVSAAPLVWLLYSFEKRYSVLSRSVQDEQGELTTSVEEAAQGIRILKSFGRSRMAFDRYDVGVRRLYGFQLAKVRMLAMIWSLIEMHPQIVLAIIVLVGGNAVVGGAMTLGTLVAFVSLFLLLLWPIASVGWLLAAAQEAATAAARVMEVFDTEPSIIDRPTVTTLAGVEGRLRFEGVSFRFPDSEVDVLRDVHLDIAPGETMAIVGVTGSGKTALTALVPRLYDVTTGAITIDGVDVRDLAVGQLRDIVAMAFEDPTLFSVSVKENLIFGRPDATDEDIAEALSVAQAEFVYDLPWGLDTRVGEQGMSLSGGQRQRLALARAVLGRPSVLVLDDPLSALDIHTEGLVEQALRRVLARTTGIVVAHRPSTVLLADRVALLQDGTITAVGTHHELMRTSAPYRDILSHNPDTELDELGLDVLDHDDLERSR